MNVSRDMLVGFQGEAGAFSEEAALGLFGHVQTQGYRSFDDLVAAVDVGEVDAALLPCENTIAGPITRSYDLLSERPRVKIVDETVHRIEQCLIGLPGADVAGVREVFSHPVALEQCRRFLHEHPFMSSRAADDTAGSVREVMRRGDPHAAAVASALAAERYAAQVLQAGIQDDEDNYTRFFVISTTITGRRNHGRVCLSLNLPHQPGTLHEALGDFARRGLNVRSLVARPRRGKPFEYTFYVEIQLSGDPSGELPNEWPYACLGIY